jgi:ABC-type transporter Mla subunit MlaD
MSEDDCPGTIRISLASGEEVRRIERALAHIIHLLEKIMATLDDVLKDVTDESTAIDSISTLISGLRQQVADALAGATLPAATQAKVDAIFTAAETNKTKIATALAANTPAAQAGGGGPGEEQGGGTTPP